MGARLDAQLRHDPRFYNTNTTENRSGSVISSFRRARLRQRMGLPESTDEDE